ncbi:MAG: AFG1/ZapE family ATPase [Paracoccaceae bacterium]
MEDLKEFNRLWENLYDDNSTDFIINYQSRELRLKKFSNGICRISFRELCEKPLSTLDYLNLCNYVKVLFLENIPQINNSQNDFARRFINLIDILYEAKIQLICFSSVIIEEIYIGKKLDKEFMRTISRLNEMISTDWVN